MPPANTVTSTLSLDKGLVIILVAKTVRPPIATGVPLFTTFPKPIPA